jgi:hypothetical protein
MKTWKSFTKGDLLGVHLAVNIFVGTTVLWLLLRLGPAEPYLGHQRDDRIQLIRGSAGTASHARETRAPPIQHLELRPDRL